MPCQPGRCCRPSGTAWSNAATASTRYFDIDPALSFDAGVPFGLNTRQMHAWMTQGEGLALTRVLFGKHNILNFPAATPARRWAAGFAARSRPSMICAA